jgi:hypothetical protein
MSYREARRQAAAANKQLDLGQQPTLATIQNAVETFRNRAIRIDEVPGLRRGEICGFWLVMEDEDRILHASTRSAWHRQQIILHEFSHMLLGHGTSATATGLQGIGLPFLGTPLKILGRSSFHDDDEVAAETLADLLARRIIKRQAPATEEPLGFRDVFG